MQKHLEKEGQKKSAVPEHEKDSNSKTIHGVDTILLCDRNACPMVKIILACVGGGWRAHCYQPHLVTHSRGNWPFEVDVLWRSKAHLDQERCEATQDWGT